MGVLYQILGAIIASYQSMGMAIVYAWPSSTYNEFASTNTTLNRPMTEIELALFGSLFPIGAFVSIPIFGYGLDVWGRKFCTFLSSSLVLVAWIFVAIFDIVEVILVAMFISGAGGALFLIVPVYVAEFCQDSIRGSLTSGTVLFYSIGILVSYLIGGTLEYRTMIYVFQGIVSFGIAMLYFLKESPVYYMLNGKEEEAAKSIAYYRNIKPNSNEVRQVLNTIRRSLNPDLGHNDNVTTPEEEKLNLEELIQREEEKLSPVELKSGNKLSLWKFIKKSRSTRQAMFVILACVTAEIFQGYVVLQVYAGPLFEVAVPNMSVTLSSTLLALVDVVCVLLTGYITDVSGRRPLMIYASLATGICCIGLGTQLHLHWGPHWITAVFIYLYCVAFVCGAGTVPFVIGAEVFLPEVKSFMTMLANEWGFLANFIVLFIFNPLVNAIGLGPVFYVFATICFATALYCFKYLPETKGLSVDVIQTLFTKRHH